MKNIILLISLLAFTTQLNAQNYNFPSNPKAGKCYERCFDYEKKFKWKEVNCKKVKAKYIKEKTEEDLKKDQQNCLKMKEYQEKLKNFGYDIDITGFADNKTIIAHHKYLKFKKKAKREKRKSERKKKEIELKHGYKPYDPS